MSLYTIPQERRRPGMMYWGADTVKLICILQLACALSLAAAVGATAFVVVLGAWVATTAPGTSAPALACGASVTVCNLSGWAKAQPHKRGKK